jgi:AcrR family transcriptional regulator
VRIESLPSGAIPASVQPRKVQELANFTEKAILQTFQDMLEEMPFDKVTVSALVSRCAISSNTFYYHYRDIYELLDAWLNGQKEAICDSSDAWFMILKRILHKMQENPRIVYHLFDSITRDRVEKYIFCTEEEAVFSFVRKQTDGLPVKEDAVKAVSNACCYSLLGFILKFVWVRMDMDVDSSVDRLHAIIDGMVERIPDLK